jgi:hypothetical protein
MQPSFDSSPLSDVESASGSDQGSLSKPAKEEVSQTSHDESLRPEYQGKWIAWDENMEHVVASADTYLELVDYIERMNLGNPHMQRAPGIDPALANKQFELMEGESPDIMQDIRATIPNPEQWLDAPNPHFGLQKPREMIGTDQEPLIRNMLRRIWNGIFS